MTDKQSCGSATSYGQAAKGHASIGTYTEAQSGYALPTLCRWEPPDCARPGLSPLRCGRGWERAAVAPVMQCYGQAGSVLRRRPRRPAGDVSLDIALWIDSDKSIFPCFHASSPRNYGPQTTPFPKLEARVSMQHREEVEHVLIAVLFQARAERDYFSPGCNLPRRGRGCMESPWEPVHAEKPLLRRWPHTTDQPREEQSREVNSANRAEEETTQQAH